MSNGPNRRRTPSPPLSARRSSAPYDPFESDHRRGPSSSYRDDYIHGNNYRPGSYDWRSAPTGEWLPPTQSPPRSTSAYYSRTPSPPPGRWQESSSWSGRRASPSPPRTYRDTMAQSMSSQAPPASLFEPSDGWKKRHDERNTHRSQM